MKEPGTENDEIPQVNHEWAVKEYRRPSVREDRKEQSPSELRPDHVLVRTMDHLVNKYSLNRLFHFIRCSKKTLSATKKFNLIFFILVS
jgi:hypothetical protein